MQFEEKIWREEIEGCLRRLIGGIGQQVLGGVIQLLGDRLAQEVPPGWRNVGTQARSLVRSLGAIRYLRRISVRSSGRRSHLSA